MDKNTLFGMSADTLNKNVPISEVFDLSGKVAVVTGSVGLALNIIERLAECGAKVAFGARNEQWGEMAEATLQERGRAAAFKKTDVRNIEDYYALVDFAEEKFGSVDIVVPAAATWGARAFVDVTEEEWDDILDTDLKGQYFTIQAAARSMIRAGHGGKVVAIASVAYRAGDIEGMGMMTPYNAAKAGVTGATRGIAKELKQYGINVNCVAPGGMATPGAITNNMRTGELYGEEWSKAVMANASVTPVAETPDQVALMVLALASPVSDFMYGQVIDVDGGSQFSFQSEPWSYILEGGKCAQSA